MNTRQIATLVALFAFTTTARADGPTYRADQTVGTVEQIAIGQEKFAMCAACHGDTGEGKVGTAPRLNSESYLTVVGNDTLTKVIRDGREGSTMIAWGKMMSDDEVAGLVALLRSWQTTDGVPLDSAPLTGDASEGGALFGQVCAGCHGERGGGYTEKGSGTGIGRKALLSQMSDGELRGVIKLGKDNTSMRPFDEDSPVAVANLSDLQIDSIIKYLRANAW